MVGADAGRPSERDGTPAAVDLVSYQSASAPCNGSGRRLHASGTDGTVPVSATFMPQSGPVIVGGATGDNPLALLDETDAQPGRRAVPAGVGRNIARADARMAEAIPDGTAAEPGFGHVETALPLLDPVRRPSEQQRAIGIGT